jgi:hypothetical protein
VARFYRVLAELQRSEYDRLRKQAGDNGREVYQEASYILKRFLNDTPAADISSGGTPSPESGHALASS